MQIWIKFIYYWSISLSLFPSLSLFLSWLTATIVLHFYLSLYEAWNSIHQKIIKNKQNKLIHFNRQNIVVRYVTMLVSWLVEWYVHVWMCVCVCWYPYLIPHLCDTWIIINTAVWLGFLFLKTKKYINHCSHHHWYSWFIKTSHFTVWLMIYT